MPRDFAAGVLNVTHENHSGHGPTLEKSFQLLKKGGKLGIVGIPKSAITIQNPLPDLVFKSLEIHTVHGRRIFHTWREVEKLIETKKVLLLL